MSKRKFEISLESGAHEQLASPDGQKDKATKTVFDGLQRAKNHFLMGHHAEWHDFVNQAVRLQSQSHEIVHTSLLNSPLLYNPGFLQTRTGFTLVSSNPAGIL